MDEELRQRLVRALQQLELLAEEGQAWSEGSFSRAKLETVSQEARQLVEALEDPFGLIPVPRAAPATPPKSDPRILRTVGQLRLVAPLLRRPDSGTRTNYLNGVLLIERRETDALGAERWVEVDRLTWPKGEGEDCSRAVFRLLAGDGWDDRELREYDK